MQVQVPKEKHNETDSHQGSGKLSPIREAGRVEGQEQSEQVYEQVIPMILGLSDDDLTGIILLLGHPETQEEKGIGNYDHEHASANEVSARNELAASNGPKDKERRETAQDHDQPGGF